MQKISLLETRSNKKEMKAKGDVNPAIKWMQFIPDEKKNSQKVCVDFPIQFVLLFI